MIATTLRNDHEEGLSALALLAHGKITRAAFEEMVVARRRGLAALEAAIQTRAQGAAVERPRMNDRHRRSSLRAEAPAPTPAHAPGLRLAGSW